MMQFIEANLGFISLILLMAVLALLFFMGIVLGELDKHQTTITKQNERLELLENYMTCLQEQLGPAIKQDFDKCYIENRQSFMAIWEYFYTMMATQGVINVNPKDFISKGIQDIVNKHPTFGEYMALDLEKDQEAIFIYLQNHFDNAFQSPVPQKPKLSIIETHFPIHPSET